MNIPIISTLFLAVLVMVCFWNRLLGISSLICAGILYGVIGWVWFLFGDRDVVVFGVYGAIYGGAAIVIKFISEE
jgi:hypothetical protein